MSSGVLYRVRPGLVPVLKHLSGQHDQATHGRGGGGSQLRNQGDEPINPDTAWVHETTWYHGTSRPGLETLDAREGGARYGNMSSGYAVQAYNFVTSDYERAAEYARDAARQDSEAGIEGVRPVVYQVTPTSDYFDPDPNGGPLGWRDGPQDMDEARSWLEETGEVSLRFHDVMDIAGAFDADTGEKVSVSQVAKHLRGQHDQKTHGHGGGSSARSDEEIVAYSQRQAQVGRKITREELGIPPAEFGVASTNYTSFEQAAAIISAQGWDAPAQRVDQETFDRLAALPRTDTYDKQGNLVSRDGFDVVYRGGPVGLEDGMVNGTPYIGDGVNGMGTYVSPQRETAEFYGVNQPPGTRGAVVPMLIPRSMTGDGTIARFGEDQLLGPGLEGVGSVSSHSGRVRLVWNTGALIVGPAEVVKSVDALRPVETGIYYKVDNGKATPLQVVDGVIVDPTVMNPRLRETRKMHGGVQMPLPFDAPVVKHPGYGGVRGRQRVISGSVLVRFRPGLHPVLKRRDANAPEDDTPVYTVGKHLQGQHDQASHGHKGGSLDSATRAALAARADELEAQGQGASAATYRLRLHRDREGVRAFTRTESSSAAIPVRDGEVATVATKAVHEVTPQARQILRDGGVSTPAIHELDPENGGAEFFHAAISRSKEGNPFHASVFVYEPSEYAGMRLFMAEDGQSGIALKGDEIVSLFKTGTSGDANVARPLMELAIEQGGRRGDCFDTVLPRIYAEHGLDVKSRIRWDDEYAPEGWDKGVYKAFNNGEPDVTFFRYDPAYTSPYSPGQGSYADSYDDAAAVTVAKRSVLVRFRPGLRPVLKHGDPSRPNYAQQHPDSRPAAARAEVTPERIAAVFEGTYTTDSGLEFRLVADQVDRQVISDSGVESPAAGGRIMVGDTAVGEWARGVEGDTMHALLLTVGKSLGGGDPGEGMSDREIQQREQEAATIGQYRGKGIALAVQRRTEEAARELGLSQIKVSTADDGDLAWANERFGYRFAEMPSGVRLTQPFELSKGDEPTTVFERDAPNSSIVRNARGLATGYKDASGKIHRVLDEREASPEYQGALSDFHRRFASDNPEEWPKPYEVAAFEGGKLLRFWGWKGVKDASHVTKAKRLMRLTVAGKGAAPGVTKSLLIRLQPSARPVLKHGDPSRPNYAQQHPGSPAVTGGLSGDGRYSEWGDRAKDIRSAEDRGPSAQQLQEGLSASYVGPTRDEMLQHLLDVERDQLDLMIDNDQSLYEDRRGIEENRSMSPRDRVSAMNDLYAYAAFQLIDESPEFVEASMGRRKPFEDEAEAIDAFDQVYRISHSGVNRNGDSISLQSSVTEVEMGDGLIIVKGEVTDGNGDTVGQFERHFSKDSSGKMQVEHELLELWDETYQGTGFATEFNRNAENYYISHGIEKIKVHAALSTGGYTWARAGYDWDFTEDRGRVGLIRTRIDEYLSTTTNPRSTPATQLRDISERMGRLTAGDPDFPTPNEIALAGFVPGVRSWAGQEIMLGSDWYGVKTLTPEGPRRSTTEAANSTLPWMVGKGASVSIRFQPGVRPVLKHGDPSRPGYAQQHPNSPALSGMQTGRLSDLPEKARKRVEAWCESNGFDVDAAADDMLRAFDDPATVAAGGRWYREEFGSAARGLAERQGISVEEASAAIAITSARTRWADAEGNLINVRTAERFYQDAAAGRYDGMTAAEAAAAVPNGYLMQRGFGQNVIAMIKGEQTIDEAVTGAKRRSFFNNGTNPDTDKSVTMDVWMGQFMVRNSTMDIGKVQNALSGSVPAYLSSAGHDVSVGYFALREATMRAHDRAVASGKVPEGWLPMQTQATVWVAMTQGVYGAVDLGEG